MEKKKNKSGFFAIDLRSWDRVCSLGLNPAVAYLVLARGTSANNETTAWSVHAIENYTGISRSRAHDAIRKLVEADLVQQLRGGTRPKYNLIPWGQQPGNRVPKREPMSDSQELVFNQIKDGVGITAKQRSVAYALVRKGWVKKENTNVYSKCLEQPEAKPDWIWLPNELVTGAGAETPPVERLRQNQDPMTLRLFIDFYHEQNLREDGGISRKFIYQEFDRVEVGQQAQFTIWGFRNEQSFVVWGGPTTVRHITYNKALRHKPPNRILKQPLEALLHIASEK